MKYVHFCAALVLVCIFAPAGLAFAATAPGATPDAIQYGDAIVAVGTAIEAPIKVAITGAIMAAIVKFAGPFGMLIRQGFVSGLVDKAVDFAFAATLGTQRGKAIPIESLPEFMRNVVRYANGHFPWVLRVLIKNTRGLVEMAIARMSAELPAEFRYTPQLVAEAEASG